MYLCVFARADHPLGWGYPEIESYDEELGSYILKSANGRAHGYSLLAVACANEDEREAVVSALGSGPFLGFQESNQYADGNLGEWFGGRFDYVGCIEAEHLSVHGPGSWYSPTQQFFCFGDNRNFAVYQAQEILAVYEEQWTLDEIAATKQALASEPASHKLAPALAVATAAGVAILVRARSRRRSRA
jgi:hypothetical protein